MHPVPRDRLGRPADVFALSDRALKFFAAVYVRIFALGLGRAMSAWKEIAVSRNLHKAINMIKIRRRFVTKPSKIWTSLHSSLSLSVY